MLVTDHIHSNKQFGMYYTVSIQDCPPMKDENNYRLVLTV